MAHDLSVIFPLLSTTEAMSVISAPCSLKQEGCLWQDVKGWLQVPLYLPLLPCPQQYAAQAMSCSPRSACLVLWPPARTIAWAIRKSATSAHSIPLRISIVRRYFPFSDVAKSTFSLGKHLLADEVSSILLGEPVLVLFFKCNWSKT